MIWYNKLSTVSHCNFRKLFTDDYLDRLSTLSKYDCASISHKSRSYWRPCWDLSSSVSDGYWDSASRETSASDCPDRFPTIVYCISTAYSYLADPVVLYRIYYEYYVLSYIYSCDKTSHIIATTEIQFPLVVQVYLRYRWIILAALFGFSPKILKKVTINKSIVCSVSPNLKMWTGLLCKTWRSF